MTFRGACIISVQAHRQHFFQAPLLFLWVIIIHQILGINIELITILLIGAIITVYQQFSLHIENTADGFFEHCIHNGLPSLAYAFVKSISIWIGTLFPMTLVLFFLGLGFSDSLIMFLQWATLSACIACILTTNVDSNPIKLLLGWLPLLTAPFIFLVDFLQTMKGNSLIILLGCDIMLISSVYVSSIFQKS